MSMNKTESITNNKSVKNINSSKKLKKYINKTNKLIEAIRAEFENDIQQPCARVEEPKRFFGSRTFDVTLCKMTHDQLIHFETIQRQHSIFLQTEQVMKDNMKVLEGFLTTLVTNKQHKKTILEYIRLIIENISLLKNNEALEIPNVKALTQQLKQNYRTITRNILQQVQPLVVAIHSRYILAYKLAAENTIGKIIHHAKKCNSFIAQCRRIACIEYCAYAWWMETQKDPMDHSPYIATAVSEGEPRQFNGSTIEVSQPYSYNACSKILITIQSSIKSPDNSFPVVFSEYLDQELAETILTEEAVCAFEEEVSVNY